MSFRKRVWIVAVLASAPLAACGETDTRPASVERAAGGGYSVSIPDGWHRAGHNLTPQITDPVEILSVATAPFGRGDGICDALVRVVPDGALVTLQERGHSEPGGAHFPQRPPRFEPRPMDGGYSTWPWCGRRDTASPIPMDHYWFGFSDAGRSFHVLVAFGKEAPEGVRSDAFELLDSLRLDPYTDPALDFSVTIPPGWRRAPGPVDDLTTNPRELFVLTTFELPERSRASDGCGPFYGHVLAHMPDDQGLLVVRERLGSDVAGPPDFPKRPDGFELKPRDPELGGCGRNRGMFRRWWIPFSDAGRDFYAQVEIGLDAPESLREEAAGALNSMKFR
jgi:hypothetical protein